MEYTRSTLIKKLGEYVGILPSELHDIACEAVELLERFETVQGEWVVTEHCSNAYGFRKWTEIECPFCGERPVYEDIESMNYCPNCGARLHKGGENE